MTSWYRPFGSSPNPKEAGRSRPLKRYPSPNRSDGHANGEGQPAPPTYRGHDSPLARGAVSLPARRFNCSISSALIRAKGGVGLGGAGGGERARQQNLEHQRLPPPVLQVACLFGGGWGGVRSGGDRRGCCRMSLMG